MATIDEVLAKVLETTDLARQSVEDSTETLATTKEMQTQAQQALDENETLLSEHDAKEDAHNALTILIKDELRAYTEQVSGGRRTIIRNDKDDPNVMYVVPKFNLEDIDASLGTGVHPAFIVGGAVKNEILIGAYAASKVNNRPVSMAHKTPWTSINLDTAIAQARACGAGFHVMTNAEWMAVALMCWKNDWNPRGNTNWGRSHTNKDEVGTLWADTRVPGDTADGYGSILTGSGPASWNHDGTSMGIADLVGNVWEWTPGLRSVDGEVQIIANNDAALATCDLGASGADWKAILASDGSLVAPGTSGTVKIDHTAKNTTPCYPKFSTTVTNTPAEADPWYKYQGYRDFGAVESAFTVPAIMKVLGIAPIDDKLEGHMWTFNTGERCPFRGGAWPHGALAGLAALRWYYGRTLSGGHFGFRLAFYS